MEDPSFETRPVEDPSFDTRLVEDPSFDSSPVEDPCFDSRPVKDLCFFLALPVIRDSMDGSYMGQFSSEICSEKLRNLLT